MFNWLNWLKELTYIREHYFGFMWLLLLAVAGTILLLLYKRWKRPQHARDSRQKTSGPDSIWIWISILTGLMIVALAGPKIDTFKTIQSQDNLNIVVCSDKSVSMTCPLGQESLSRHEVMVKEVTTFVNSPVVHGGDRLTLFTFSEKSNWRMPLSDDRGEFLDKLLEIEHPKDRVYYDRSQLYTYFGRLLTHIPDSLAEQDQAFQKGRFSGMVSWTSYPTVIFILSDGDSIDDSLIIPLAYLAKQGMKVYTIGIGTLQVCSMTIKIPKEDNPSQLEQIRFSSKLNMKALNLISEKTGGKSYVVNSSSNQVQSFMAAALAENRKPTLTLAKTGEAKNFWWDLLAIPAFVIVLLIGIKFIRS